MEIESYLMYRGETIYEVALARLIYGNMTKARSCSHASKGIRRFNSPLLRAPCTRRYQECKGKKARAV